jgi:hypothetical protein
MTNQLRAYLDNQAQEFENSVRQALEIAGGDAMAAVRALVIANVFLHEEDERLRAQIRPAFARGRMKKAAS